MHDTDRQLANGRFELPATARRIIVVPIERRGEPRQVPIVACSNGLIRRFFGSGHRQRQKLAP